MERNIKITLEKAKEWYNSNNESLKDIALQAFSEKELTAFDFTRIRTFEDACKALGLNFDDIVDTIANIIIFGHSKASAAMFKLNIIRKALNLGQDLHFAKDPKDSYTYYPCNPLVTKSSTYYDKEVNLGKMEVIGKIKSEGEEYLVLGGSAANGGVAGLGHFSSGIGVGYAYATVGLLGCASKEIAQHFGKYFGMTITEAKYGDLQDFQIISRYRE